MIFKLQYRPQEAKWFGGEVPNDETLILEKGLMEQLDQIATYQPVWDGDLISKTDRTKLRELGLIFRYEDEDLKILGYAKGTGGYVLTEKGKRIYELNKAISNFKPIAPQDQEKVTKFIFDIYWTGLDHKSDVHGSKLYDSGDLEFELKVVPCGSCFLLQGQHLSPDCCGKYEQFWVLKSKVEEKVKKENRDDKNQLIKSILKECDKEKIISEFEVWLINEFSKFHIARIK